MKKVLCILSLILAMAICLSGCGPSVPQPEIREGEFDVSVTYEVDGEAKTLSLVYICKYDGIGCTVEGSRYRVWSGHFEGYGDGDVIDVLNTEDGGRVALCFLIYPEYFMGEPDYAEDFYPHVLTNYIYYEDGAEMVIDDRELIAEEYGVKVTGCEYDSPITNSFGNSK